MATIGTVQLHPDLESTCWSTRVAFAPLCSTLLHFVPLCSTLLLNLVHFGLCYTCAPEMRKWQPLLTLAAIMVTAACQLLLAYIFMNCESFDQTCRYNSFAGPGNKKTFLPHGVYDDPYSSCISSLINHFRISNPNLSPTTSTCFECVGGAPGGKVAEKSSVCPASSQRARACG